MSWFSKLVEKKIMEEVAKQFNVKASRERGIEFQSLQKCKFCKAVIPKGEVFCPKCRRSLT